MPIMSVTDQNDSRGTAQVLAVTARRCLEGQLDGRRHAVALNNIFKLLHAYRAHRFEGYKYEPRTQRGPESLTLMPTPSPKVAQVTLAIEQALAEAFGQDDRDKALDALDHVIIKVASDDTAGLDDEQRRRAAHFLGSFVTHLQPSA